MRALRLLLELLLVEESEDEEEDDEEPVRPLMMELSPLLELLLVEEEEEEELEAAFFSAESPLLRMLLSHSHTGSAAKEFAASIRVAAKKRIFFMGVG